MTSASSNPIYGASSFNSAQSAGGRQRLALDNLIRRELRVSDPGDPEQIAKALLERYQADPRTAAIAQEAKGLPFLQASPVSMAAPGNGGSTAAELKQAMADVEHDLGELLSHSTLKDARPQLEGWALAIRNAAGQGVTAARFALDPGQRDKAFAARRTLGGYARLSRLVGTFAPEARSTCRSLAQSVDEVAAIIIVSMGEALATSGYTGIGELISVSYSDLQTRRDAVIFALRNLVGSTQLAYGPNEWPRGLDGYRELHSVLGQQGLGDLRTLLNENELALVMDELIRRTAESGADGLRVLSGSAEVELDRFRRLVAAVEKESMERSPALTAFLEAFQLFLDAFEHGTGARLLRVGRPPLLYYGLYSVRNPQQGEKVLDSLITMRGGLALGADCLAQCSCENLVLTSQVFFDKILYDMDRAIDLFAVGKMDSAPTKVTDVQAEVRAAAFGYVIKKFLDLPDGSVPGSVPQRSLLPKTPIHIYLLLKDIQTELKKFVPIGFPINPPPLPGPQLDLQEAIQTIMTQELGQQWGTEERLRDLIANMVPGCHSVANIFSIVETVLHDAVKDIDSTAPFEELTLPMPKHADVILASIDSKI